jgi:hypothetical protein
MHQSSLGKPSRLGQDVCLQDASQLDGGQIAPAGQNAHQLQHHVHTAS